MKVDGDTNVNNMIQLAVPRVDHVTFCIRIYLVNATIGSGTMLMKGAHKLSLVDPFWHLRSHKELRPH